MTLLFLLAELLAVYFLSRALTQSVYNLVYLMFRTRSIAVMVVTLINFPGTVIHELSHLFTAEVLGVHTGKLSLVPESIEEEEGIQAGSVMIAKTDPFRRYAIGTAPLLSGLVVLSAISYFLPQLVTDITTSAIPFYSNLSTIYLLLATYLLLAVSNSMFSSSEDVKGFVPFAIAVGIIVLGAYLAGLRIGLTGSMLAFTDKVLVSLMQSMRLVLGLNVAGLIVSKLLMIITEKLTRRKIVRS